MSDNVEIEYKDFGLKNLVKMLKADDIPQARVGILGGKNARKDDGSNASIGAKHEFGDDGMPIRSFLRIPLSENFQKYLETAGLNKETMEQILKNGEFINMIRKLGVLGEKIVLDAFDSGGFGKWKPSNMKFKKNHQTLVETQQLRDSITSDVVG